jgi:RNA polymerase sigma factor (sigma-70 family)
MARGMLDAVLRHMRKLAEAQAARDVTDGELLERFVRRREEAAFTLLVQRHGPMVLGVCRRVLGDEHAAEDAFQATFLVLARRAAAVRKRDSLGSWLHGVAQRIAGRARSQAATRRGHERRAVGMPSTQGCDELTWQELRRTLDEELAQLPEKYRAPLVLSYLEGKTHEQAAQELGWPKSSLSTRLGRGRELLRERLARRGVTLSAGVLTAALAHQAAPAAVPALLTLATVRAAGAVVSGNAAAAGVASREALGLAEGALKALPASRLKLLAALVVLAGVAAGGGILARRGEKVLPSEARKEDGRPPAARPPEKAEGEAHTRADRYGDPLPEDAVARLGTLRFRHGGKVQSVAFSPDGHALASASEDHHVRLWEVATGKLLRQFRWHQSPVLAVALSPDGKVLASAGDQDNPVRLWDLATGQELHPFRGPPGRVQSLAFAPDGGTLLSGGADGTLRLWEAATGKELHRWRAPHRHKPDAPGGVAAGLRSVAFSSDGRTLASGGSEGTVCLWEAATGRELPRPPPHQGPVFAVAFSPDGKTLASAGSDLIRLVDVPSAREVRRLEGHRGATRSVAFSPDGQTLACGTDGNLVCLWGAATGKLYRCIEGHQGAVNSVAFSPDGQAVASGSYDDTIRLWDVTTGGERVSFGGHQGMVLSAAFAPDGRLLATAGQDQAVRLWDVATGRELRRLEGHKVPVNAVAFCPDGQTVVTAGGDEVVRLWEAATGAEVRQLRGHQGPVTCLAVSPDGALLATGSQDQTIRLWETATGRELRRFGGGQGQGICVAFAPDGRTLISSSADNTVRLWEVATGRELRRVGDHHGWPLSVAFSPDGKSLATGRDDGLIRLWDAATGRQTRELRGHRNWVSALAFSPDGKTLASSSYSGALRLWEVATGRERYRSPGHRGAVWSLAFSLDGRLLASTGSDTTVLLRDTTDGSLGRRSPRAGLAPEQGEAVWNDLGGDDAARAYQALCALLQTPKQAVGLLRERLREPFGADPVRITGSIRELDDDDFAVRQRASERLAKWGDAAEPALRRALEAGLSAEQRWRVESLLEGLQGRARSAERLRGLRVTEVLERLASPEARHLLGTLAKGPPDAWLTREARASLGRLAGRSAAAR